jgi:hypothetical protein
MSERVRVIQSGLRGSGSRKRVDSPPGYATQADKSRLSRESGGFLLVRRIMDDACKYALSMLHCIRVNAELPSRLDIQRA